MIPPVAANPADVAPRRIRVLDATLRDGDQAAGFAFSVAEKLEIALALADAGVDVIEAGFPLSSRADGESCALVSRELSARAGAPAVSFFCRAVLGDIERTARFFSPECRSVLHLSLPVSDVHIRAKFGLSRRSVLDRAVESVRAARSLASEVEMGAEDATRADRAFLAEYCDAVTSAGARTVNVADTVGRALPGEFGELVAYLRYAVPAFRVGSASISVHCHDDLGLAAANTVAAVQSGCDQIEVCALGLGERSGNAALEELSAILSARGDALCATTGIALSALAPLARLVSLRCGTAFSPLKSVTGSSARAHASGIHQSALSRDIETYSPGSVADGPPVFAPERIVLSRHSGKAGVASAARAYAGIELGEARAAELLDVIKETLPDSEPAFGVTEFLSLLNDRDLMAVSTVRCRDLEFSSARGQCEISGAFDFGASPSPAGDRRENGCVTGRGPTPGEAALDLVERATGIDLSVRALAVSSYDVPSHGVESGAKWRVYIEAIVSGDAEARVFAVERVGCDRDRATVDALLDAVNAHRALTA